jgi:outer membrane protein assembly factor BamB
VAGNRVLARTNDGRLSAFNAEDGRLVWTYQRATPALILRNFAAPVVSNGVVYLGMAGGKLAAISLADGRQIWETAVATPRGASELERIADIVSAPVVDGNQVCAAAFQGRVACLNARDGVLLWARDLSSWAGLALDQERLYVSDDRGYVNALERTTGRSVWRQEKLAGREVSGPAFDGKQVFVGDFEGYVHALDANTGALTMQIDTDGGRIAAAPRGMAGRVLVQTQRGGLFSLGAK